MFQKKGLCNPSRIASAFAMAAATILAFALGFLTAPEAFAESAEQADDANANQNVEVIDLDDISSVPLDDLADMADLTLSTQASKAQRPTDIVFIVDTTGSMGSYIGKVKSNLISFVKRLKELGVNPRMALVEYRDVYADGGGSTVIHQFGSANSYWTKRASGMINRLGKLKVAGGGDTAETPTHAINKFLNNTNFKKDSDRFVFLLTDANYKTRDSSSSRKLKSMDQCIKRLSKEKAHTIVVSKSTYRSTYYSLFNNTDGDFIDIDSSSYSTMLYSTATWIGNLVLESYKLPKATAKIGTCYYTGYKVKPKLVVKCCGKKLKYGRDYVIVYSNNVKPGRGTATIYARGNYVGSKGFTFKILRAKISKATVKTNPVVYNGHRQKPTPVRVAYKRHALQLGVDYKIVKYGNNLKAGNRAYYVIRGIGNYQGTKKVYFKIKKAPISLASAKVKSVTYSGKAKKPKPTLTFNGKKLKAGRDYKIKGYARNVNAGSRAVITLKGTGNFKGTMKVRFSIKKANLKKTKAKVKAVVYTGKKQKPKVKLTFNGKKLKAGRDYKIVKYKNNVKAGKRAIVKLKGKGNFKGAKLAYFTIKRASIADATGTIKAPTYTGKKLKPKLQTLTLNGKKLKAGRDYKIARYEKNVKAGNKAAAVVKGIGNYKGAAKVHFSIKKVELSAAKAKVKTATYNGKAKKPLPVLTYKGKKLKAGRDFKIIGYTNNVKAGKNAVVKLRGKGSFKGVKKVKFTIEKSSKSLKSNALVA